MNTIIWRQTIGDLLHRTAQRCPEKTAITSAGVTWTYAQFNHLCDRLAAGLVDIGITTGAKVAVLSRNSHSFAALRYAVARLGAILVPVNFMLNSDEVAYILKHSGATLLCCDSEHAQRGRQAAAASTAIANFMWLPGEKSSQPEPGMLDFNSLAASGNRLPIAHIDGHSVAQIIYTSGTESQPKGALLTHQAVIWQYVSCLADIGIEADDIHLHALPLYHCAQLDVFLGPSVYVGGTNVITANTDPQNLLTLIERHKITSFFAPPTVWISLLRCDSFDQTDLSSLTKGYYGAAIMPIEVLREIQQRLPRIRLWNCYGQTEIAPLAVVLKPADQLRKAGSAGRPVLNVETRVIGDAGQPVAAGEIGEIVHRSPQLMNCYYRDAERTREVFSGGWFHSGDLATVDEEGYITVVDRKKDMIKTGGENVSSREVEEMIYRLPAVAEVAVIALPDPKWVEAIAAVVVLRNGDKLSTEALTTHCRANMAHFKVPKQVYFVDSLPKNPSGKILKRELRNQYTQ